MRALAGIFCLLTLLGSFAQGQWRAALPGWQYEFPRDHEAHSGFKTEWWYFTGNVADEKGRRFGYELTLFRQGVRPPGEGAEGRSRLLVDSFHFAHFAISDVSANGFYFEQKISRGAFGDAGNGPQRLAWIEDWTVDLDPDGKRFKLHAATTKMTLDLDLTPLKPWTIHGENGVSQKAAGEGHASHYYSGTRMKTQGALSVEGRRFEVRGESWFDHEWATNQLAPGQVGWNWFSIQLADGTELMLYQMRLKDGGIDPASSGSWIARDGSVRHLRREDYELVAGTLWTSKTNGARYPIAWRIKLPALDMELEVSTPLAGQELALAGLAYWEGLIEVKGTRAGQPIAGHGYMELTGYAGALTGLGGK